MEGYFGEMACLVGCPRLQVQETELVPHLLFPHSTITGSFQIYFCFQGQWHLMGVIATRFNFIFIMLFKQTY